MKQFTSHIPQAFSSDEFDRNDELYKAIRIGQVRAIWAELVEDAILQHTNGVYILKDDGKTVMKVYVDESIYAAELNNRRELIMLLCKQRFNEVVDEFQIYISHGLMKKRYPYRDEKKKLQDQNPPIPLTEDELQEVKNTCNTIENPTLRAEFEKAMIADLEWKKGNP